jgi:GNAT superfamily N-acetyltransferase
MAAMNELLDPLVLLDAYDSQLRARQDGPLPPGAVADWDGPARRISGLYGGGFLDYKNLDGLDGEELDAFIARQIAYFAAKGEKFEWKTRGHDRPADLPDRLVAHGFVPEERETVEIGLAAQNADAHPSLPVDMRIRQTSDRADFERIAAMSTEVWSEDHSFMADMLEVESAGGAMNVFLAEAGDRVVSAAWIRFVEGTDFAGLWGGSTLETFRGRGLYRGLVAVRAALAVQRGYRYLQVDASDESRPILERLGFVPVTTTTPYIWTPPGSQAG